MPSELTKQHERQRPASLGIPSAFPRSRVQHREQRAGEPQARGRNARKLGLASQTPVSAIPPQSDVIALLRDVTPITAQSELLRIAAATALRPGGPPPYFPRIILQSRVGTSATSENPHGRRARQLWLQGMSSVVQRFLLEKSPDRHITNMTIDDALDDRSKVIEAEPD